MRVKDERELPEACRPSALAQSQGARRDKAHWETCPRRRVFPDCSIAAAREKRAQ